MVIRFQIGIDCADPERLAHFWADALGYAIGQPPAGFHDWKAYWRSRGLSEEEIGEGDDSIVDPDGAGPRIWFQKVDEGKVVKHRVHLDLRASGGEKEPRATREARVNASAERLVRSEATRVGALESPGVDH